MAWEKSENAKKKGRNETLTLAHKYLDCIKFMQTQRIKDTQSAYPLLARQIPAQIK